MELTKDIHGLQELMEQKPYYKAALLAANMVESGLPSDRIVLTRRSAVWHGASHDIDRLLMKYPYLDPENPYVEIRSGKVGIYDLMAEGLFFVGGKADRERDKKKIIDRIRRDKETEKVIRKFMGLFEVESDFFSMQIHVEELKYDKPQIYGKLAGFFAQHWKKMSFMSKGEVLRMLKVFPYISGIRGDMGKSAKAISFIMDMDVKMTKAFVEVWVDDMVDDSSDIRLGDNFVLRDGVRKRFEETVVMTISGLNACQCGQFIKRQGKEMIVNYLCDMMLDANLSVQINIEPEMESRNFYLSQLDGKTSYLGINTYL